ncbi:type I methionyl aminopeptidase [Candidatus Peregrinibacteria bacterium]|nr:type I methionyl aminopeptidase [Candidatus Peregrinibacteria bacterium]
MDGFIPIKTPAQIRAMREGGRILREALLVAEKAVCPGITTYDLDKIVEKTIVRHKGAQPGFKGYRGFPATLCTSVNEEVVHGIPSHDRILKEGDIVGIDCGVYYKGLYTDACITVMVGRVRPEVSHFVKTTKKALKNAIKKVRPGGYVGDISAAIQKTLEDQNYSPVIECTGHGVGENLHEPPEILNVGQKGTGPLIKPGMVFAIEPISAMGDGAVITAEDGWTVVTADKSLSAHFEHTVLVTKKDCEVLV